MNKLIQGIENSYDDLPDSQKRVARYITNNYEEVAFCTLDDVAKKIGVSTTTIIRFARCLGYSGYSDLLEQIRLIIKAKITLPERLRISAKEIKHDQLLLNSFNLDVNNIKETLEELEYAKLEEVVASIVNGRNVYVIGMRSSFALAHFFAITLGQIRENVRLLHSVGSFCPEEEIISAKEGDVGVVFSFSRYTKLTIDIAASLKKQGVKIVGISDSAVSPITEIADIILPCKVKRMMFKNSLVAPLSLINYIISAASVMDEEKALEVLLKNEEICRQFGYHII